MITLQPIATVHCDRIKHENDHWGEIVSRIVLASEFPEESLDGIDHFSHLEITFYMDQVQPDEICRDARHPRGNPAWPKVGIFAHRARNRPNQIGLSICQLLRRDGRTLTVRGLDALEGTPVLDIKPVFKEFLPRGEVRQPGWVSELAKEYF